MDQKQYIEELKVGASQDAVVKVSLGKLRSELNKSAKLGKHVASKIKATLETEGFLYFPSDVFDTPSLDQSTEVRLVLRDSDSGRIVQAVISPNDASDKAFREIMLRNSEDAKAQVKEALSIIENAQAALLDILES